MMDTIEGCRLGRPLQLNDLWKVVLVLGLLLLLVACSDDDSAATVTPNIPTSVPLLPTLSSLPTVTLSSPASTLALPSSPLDTQVSTAVTSTLSLTLPIMPDEDFHNDGNPVVAGVTTTMTSTLTANATPAATADLSTSNVPLTDSIASRDEQELCTTETDIALLSYPAIDLALGCALSPASFEAVALNEFGLGPDYDRYMLWFSSENQIYALMPDKTWQVYADTWTEEQETFTCNPLSGEASSPPLPRRGFGKIWCSVEGMQALMGTIEREERLCQHTVTQRFAYGRLVACYEDATIRYFRIMDDYSWDQMLIR